MLEPKLETSAPGASNKALSIGNVIGKPVAYASDLVELSKPGILVLLLISTACPMIVAAQGNPGIFLILMTLAGGGLISASASAMNCIWDMDIDAVMERTKGRALPAGRLKPLHAMIFSLLTGVAGLAILFQYVSPMAAFLSLLGHLFYVLIYTVWLKRMTAQNIVIGGAAGAIPPLVGWAAVTGQVSIASILMFLVVFLWTPPHFWALAINKNEDYRKAKVPMMPVVAGDGSTAYQMFVYALALIPTSVWLVFECEPLGEFSMTVLVALALYFSWSVFRLDRAVVKFEKNKSQDNHNEKEKQAWSVFKFSLVYLALFFATTVVDATLI